MILGLFHVSKSFGELTKTLIFMQMLILKAFLSQKTNKYSYEPKWYSLRTEAKTKEKIVDEEHFRNKFQLILWLGSIENKM